MPRRPSCDCGACSKCRHRQAWQARTGRVHPLPVTFEDAVADLAAKRAKVLHWPPVWEADRELDATFPWLQGVRCD